MSAACPICSTPLDIEGRCGKCGLGRVDRPGGPRAGAGRPVGPLGRSYARSISLPKDLWDKADALAEARGLPSRSALFVQLLKRARA